MYYSLTNEEVFRIEAEVIMMLLTSRQAMSKKDREKYFFNAGSGFYGEAFGIMRGLAILGYGTYDLANNIPPNKTNLKWWFDQLQNKALEEEKNLGLNNAQDKYKEIVNVGYKQYMENRSARQRQIHKGNFKLGDLVEWMSNDKVKKGVVFEIIPPNTQILTSWRPKIIDPNYMSRFKHYNTSKLGSSSTRNHKSYVILVNSKYLYWPNVKSLILMRK